MILSVSRRTDIPAYYLDWFFHRLREGFVLVPTPMNPGQVRRVPLSPGVVEGIVFWSKNPTPLLGRLDELERLGYRCGVQFTLTPYGPEWEPGLPDKEMLLEVFAALSRRLGRGRVVWRYDPILLDRQWTVLRHRECFDRMAQVLAPYTSTVIISFVDRYQKHQGNLRVQEVGAAEMEELAGHIGAQARQLGLDAKTCCEQGDFSRHGVRRGGCMDLSFLEEVCGCALDLGKSRFQRAGCGCRESVDMGVYDTCPAGCVYCYANRGSQPAQRAHQQHNPLAEQLGAGPNAAVVREFIPPLHRLGQCSLYHRSDE